MPAQFSLRISQFLGRREYLPLENAMRFTLRRVGPFCNTTSSVKHERSAYSCMKNVITNTTPRMAMAKINEW